MDWYIMHSYKNEKTAEKMLEQAATLDYFIPKEQVMRTRNGKKTAEMTPVIPGLIFVHSSQKAIVAFKKQYYNDLQFVIWHQKDGTSRYLTVSDTEMRHFICMCKQREKHVTFFRPDEIQTAKGVRVRVHGGVMDNVEGILVKVAHKRSKQVVVLIPDTLAVSAEVEPEYLEILE